MTPQTLLTFGTAQGIIAGAIFLLGASIIALLPRFKWLAAAVLLILITPIALAGFWFTTGTLGISDWDYYFSLHENLRNSLLAYNNFPFWNPYTCGGTAGLADPEFPVFAPTFLLELITGIPKGFKLAIFLSVATTALGMLMLARKLNLSVYASLLAAIGVAFGSVNLLEIVEGHPNIFAVMWIPWIFWSWFAAYQNNDKKPLWKIICGIFCTLTFFQGGIYLLSYTALAWSVLIILARNRRHAFSVSLQAGIWAVGFAAIKLIPAFLWLRQFQDAQYASSTYTLPYLDKILLGRYLHGAGDIIPNQGSGWHEYGAYIGPIILILAAISIVRAPKKRLVRVLITTAVLAILISSAGPLLKPLFDMAPFIPRSNISRVILFAIIPVSLLAGYGLDVIRNTAEKTKQHSHQKWQLLYTPLPTLLTLAILGLAAIDLMSLSYQLSEQAFVLPTVAHPIPPAPSPIAFTALTYTYRYSGDDYTRAYAATKAGYGTLSYCSVLTPPPMVRTIHDEVDKDIISLKAKDATYQLLHWSPNTVRVHVTTPEETSVTLNTNYAEGWYANNQSAKNADGRVSTKIPTGTHTVKFHYKTPGFTAGLLITVATSIGATTIIARQRHKKKV